ncbi:hypothetical protein [Pontibacter vulgaris]|uniref:hypothetical protein n=1 Tax=Pontibacter vulgaris TaxID=2905679 RepID=UPI001FA7B211|nr:hypothetical protein [Pontibacter vulgaris]
MRHKLLPLFFFLTILTAQAQTKFSGKPADFVGEAKAMLLAGKVENAEKLSADLEEIWSSGKLTNKQQQDVIKISQHMYRKRLRTKPHFQQFYTMVVAGVNNHNLRGSALDNMLDVTDKAVQQEEMTNLERFLHTSSLYLSSGRLFQNTYYTLRTSGGAISFAYEGGASPKDGAKATENNSEWDDFSWDDEAATKDETATDDGWGTITEQPKKADSKKASKNRQESIKKRFIPAMPKVNGPTLKLENTTLTFVTPWDSVSVNNTSGQLMLARNLFVGEGGSYDWQPDGKPASVILRKYAFDISFAGFKAPDVTLTYPALLEEPVEGAFEMISGKRKSGNYPYPKFTSFTNNAKVRTHTNNIAYKGGFSLTGNIAGSNSLDGSLSEIVVMQDGVRKFRSMARSYTMNDSLILANRASIAIYQQKDSLTHPAMQLRFSKTNKELILTKDKGPFSRTPFYDTYHKLEIVAERLHWDLNTQDVNFSILNTKTLIPVQFESTQYYSNNRYQQLVGVATFHPLQALVAYAAKAKTNEFYASEVSNYNKINESAIKEAANNLSREGYLNYEPQSGFIALKPKAWHYVGSSRKKNDYDHLIIKSVVPSGRNATLNLADNKLTVRGVKKITFNNDTSAVYVLPKNSEIRVLKNRDIEFDGQVYASRLAFKGHEFKFNYDEFMIDLQKLDTIAMVSKKRRATGGEATDQVLTGKGGKLSGKLYINKPNNKSGKDFFPEYPKFDAPIGARVAFNRPDVLGGAYDSTVFFDMPPFKLDSLSAGKGAVAFDGTFNSGGIFPPIKTKLQMMPDETLGFYYKPSAAGLPAFGGKGIVFDTIMMNSEGIQSKGKLKYLTATLESPKYTYYQNAVVTKQGTKASIAEGKIGGGEFPVATLTGFNMNWLPKADTMYLQTQKEPMQVFKEQYAFKGVAKLAPGGMYGSGIMENPAATVTSADLAIKQRSFSGKHAQMVVKSDVAGKAGIKADGVQFAYDLTKGQVDFEIEKKGEASIEFPKAQYKTSMSSAKWDIKAQKVTLKADENNAKNYFYSMHPQQDSLQFMAASGDYNLKDNVIRAGGVPYIAVADSYVVPDSGKVSVAADATIKTLRNAKILTDSVQQYHKLYAGNIDVLSRKAFKGSAIHDYSNAAADSFKLQFSDFTYSNPRGKKNGPVFTHAVANIGEAKPFYIFPRTLYRGKVTMNAPLQYLDFDGDLKFNFSDKGSDSDWFPYKKDSLNPQNIRIPIKKMQATDGTPLYTGLHISKSSAKLYNTFVSKKQDAEDLDLFVVDGLLSYDKSKTEFKMGREERAYGDSYEGNVLLYNEAANTFRFEGKLNPLKTNKDFKITASGNGTGNADSSRYNLDAFLAFDMTMPAQALTAMAGNIRGNSAGAVEAMDGSDATLYKLGEFIGNRGVRDYIQQTATGHVPLPKVSKQLVRSLILNKVNLRWSNEKNAWYSVGKISLASMLKEDVNTQLDGYLEMRQDMNGEPAVNLYLQADPYTWYYFSFFENGLTLASSDDKFNKAVRSKSKGGRGTSTKYGIYAGEAIEKNQFIEQFRYDYLKGKDGFKIAADQPRIDEGGKSADFTEEEATPKKEKGRKKKNKKNDPFAEDQGGELNNQ